MNTNIKARHVGKITTTNHGFYVNIPKKLAKGVDIRKGDTAIVEIPNESR